VHFGRSVPSSRRNCCRVVEDEGSRLLQKFCPEDGRKGFLRDLGICETSRVTVAALFFATSLKIPSLAKLCSIPHLPLSPYTLGPYFPFIAPPPPFQQLCHLQCTKYSFGSDKPRFIPKQKNTLYFSVVLVR
jgi:hypothetical protein